MTHNEILTLFYAALESPRGILVQTSSAEKLKQKCYIARATERKNMNTEFDRITFQTSPGDPIGELWLVLKPQAEIDNGEK